MKNFNFRRIVAWTVMATMTLTQATQVAALTLATQPLAASTTDVVRPNIMYVLDDSGSMAWDYTPDYINDSTTAADPGSQGGSAGDGATAYVSAGKVTNICSAGQPVGTCNTGWGATYSSAPAVIIEGGGGTGASAHATVSASTKKITSITVDAQGTGYTSAPYVALVGGLSNASWGMCWGTTGTNNLGGTPKDTTVSPTCTTKSQPPYATSEINYQFYDPAVRYTPPLNANGTSYANATATAAKVNGFSGTSSTTNLTTSWPHEVWCNVSTATPTAADPTAAGKCRENLDSSNDTLYPNATYNFRKTYNGPASYYIMSPAEFCADTDLTNCVRATTPQVVSGVSYNIPAKYRWCSYYNPITHTYGNCQARRDLSHYIPNYLGGWVSTGTPGSQASGTLTIRSVSAGQSIESVTVGGVDIVGGATFAEGASFVFTTAPTGTRTLSTTNDVAQAICETVNANTGSSGYGCSRTNNQLILQSAIVGTAANGLTIIVAGPPSGTAVNSTGRIDILSAPLNYQITGVTITRTDTTTAQLIGSSVVASTACGGSTGLDCGAVAQTLCTQINSGPEAANYHAKSGDPADATLNYGTCQNTSHAAVMIERISADDVDNGATITVSGPPTGTQYSGTITLNATGGPTRINDITIDLPVGGPTSILSTKPLNYPNGTIPDGNATALIAADIASKISIPGCTASVASGSSTINIGGSATCNGDLIVTATGAQATGVFRVSNAGTSGHKASLGGIDVGTTHILGTLTNTDITNITAAATNSTLIQGQINAATSAVSRSIGPTGFTASAPVANGSDYDITVTAPAGNAYNNQSFSFLAGTTGTGSGGTPSIWSFQFQDATTDNKDLTSITCGGTEAVSTRNTGTGSPNADYVLNLVSGLNGQTVAGVGGNYSYACSNAAMTSPAYRCTLTGPIGAPACANLSISKDATISLSTTTPAASGGSAGTGTWTLPITSASLDSKKITSVTCGGTDVIATNTASTGTPSTYVADLSNGLVAAGTGGYSYAKIAGATGGAQRVRLTGPTGGSFCNASLDITKNAGITLKDTGGTAITTTLPTTTAGSAGVAGTAATYSITLTGATTDDREIHALTCGSTCVFSNGNPSSGACNNSVNSGYVPNTGTATTPWTSYADTLATNLDTQSANQNGWNGTSNCSDSGSTVSCAFQRNSGRNYRCSSVAISDTGSLTPGTVTESWNGSRYVYSFDVTSVTTANETINQVTCTPALESLDSVVSWTGNTDDFSDDINTASDNLNGWNGNSNCSRIASGHVRCTFERSSGASNRCTSGLTITSSGITVDTPVESLSGSTYRYTVNFTNIGSGDSLSSVVCNGPTPTTQTSLSAAASTGTAGSTDTAVVQRLNNLKDDLNAITNLSGYSFSCTTATNGTPSSTCTLTGPVPTSSPAPTCTFDTSSTISPTDPTLTNTGGTPTTAGTGATWTFDVISATGDLQTIGPIKCGVGGSNTLSTTATTQNNNDARITNLKNSVTGTGSYTATCAALTGSVGSKSTTCTIQGPNACSSLITSQEGGITFGTQGYSNTGTPPTWTFDITDATAASKTISGISCGVTSLLPATAPNTGTATATTAVQRINNLTGATTSPAASGSLGPTNGYTLSCPPATSGSPTPTCTLTGPLGPPACGTTAGTGFVITKDSSIVMGPVTLTQTGVAAPVTDDFAANLTQVSAFTGGVAPMGSTVTGIPRTGVATGTISTNASTMSNGTESTTKIPTSSTAFSGGTDPDVSANHWTRTGILKRTDVVSTNNIYNRGSGRTDCAGATCTYAEEIQNFANWYTYYQTRMQMMKSATTAAFSQLDGKYRVGFDNICSATGTTIQETVGQFIDSGGETANQRTNWWSKLTAANPSCATPLRTETAKIGKYYGKKLGTVADPIQYSCQQNFMILVTDGYWNESDPGSTSLLAGDIGNVDNNSSTAARPFYDGQQASTTCPSTGATRSSASSCRTLSDIAWYYYSTDLRSSTFSNTTNAASQDISKNNVMVNADDPNQSQHMNFYAMGLGIDGTLSFKTDYQTSGTGDFAEIKAGTKNWPAVSNLDPTGVDDLWHATVNGHGKYFSARNVPNVVAGLREALNKIGSRVGSAAAAATSNLEPVAGDNFAYVASYATVDWTGDLQSRSIDLATGNVSADTNCAVSGSGCQWSAQALLDNMTWSARRIYVKPSSGTSGDPLRPFLYSNLSASEKLNFDPSSLSQYAALSVSNPTDITDENLVDFLRGYRGLEQDGDITHAQIWRRRAHVLGDIVDTQPIFMKAPSQNYGDLGYATYKTTGTAATRKPVVFISAQDGMLHAINAYTGSVTIGGVGVAPGEELWAYIPTQSMIAMKTLADVNYTHRYFVDGPITVADVNFGGGDSDWHTILIAGQGGGGTSYFALDVTDPLNPTFLWEFTDAKLGYTVSNTTVTKLPNGEWAVVFTSGYNNTDGIGYLFAVNPKTGAVKTGYPLSTGSGSAGSPSNLGKLSVWSTNPTVNNSVELVYAGDLNGDLWRFDISGATGTAGDVFKLAHLASSGGVAQPITTKPELTELSDGTRVVYVGTGKYLETTDMTSTTAQSFYAMKDTLGADNGLGSPNQATWNPQSDTVDDAGTPVAAFLKRKLISTKDDGSVITQTVNGATRNFRMVCAGGSSTVDHTTGNCTGEDPTVIDWGLNGGWFVDLPESRERMNVDMKLVQGTLVFATNVPAADSCTVGGTAWFNTLDFRTGLSVGSTMASAQIADSLVVGVTAIKIGDTFKAIVTKSNYQQETLTVDTSGGPGGFLGKRGLWREFEAY